MFSESPKTMDPSDFFSYFNKFVTEWKVKNRILVTCYMCGWMGGVWG